FGFLGPNGAGKTTAVKILTGLARPSGGHGTLLGRPLGDIGARVKLGFLPELFRFQEWLTAQELLRLHGDLCRMDRSSQAKRIPEVLELVGLAQAARQRINTFSKGMQQRLGLAQALLNWPELVILDEPTSALDPLGRRDVRLIIQRLKAQGVTVFLNSHLLSEVEMTCDRVAIVSHGRVIEEGRVEDLVGAQPKLELRVDRLDESSAALLAERWAVMERSAGRLVIALAEPRDAAEVARFLVSRGADLLEMKPLHATLEDRFVELVEREEDGSLDLRPVNAARSVA
ncbi:MAG: ABC transporter ATP-binding protein, partial [Chloroflexota bacterium]